MTDDNTIKDMTEALSKCSLNISSAITLKWYAYPNKITNKL